MSETFNKIAAHFGVPPAETEFRFAPPRRWRFDYAFPAYKIALEVEGGIFIRGRHSRGAGMLKDMEKYSEAAVLGWCVIRVQPSALFAPSTFELIKRAIQLREAA